MQDEDKGQDNIDEALEMFEGSYYLVPVHDSETGNTKVTRPQAPSFKSMRKIKQRHPDYRPGKVKHYTEEEIQEYEAWASNDKSST